MKDYSYSCQIHIRMHILEAYLKIGDLLWPIFAWLLTQMTFMILPILPL